jgi:glycosyltransferase involved in cell wall biosynthesis
VVAPGPPWAPGGVERSAGRLISCLDGWGLEWRYFSGFNEQEGAPPGFVRVCGPLLGPEDRVAFGWLAPWAAVRYRPDVVHIHGSEYGWGIGPALLLSRQSRRTSASGKPSVRPNIVVTCHGTLRSALIGERAREPRSRRWSYRASETAASLVESRVLKHATVVVCVSELVRSEVVRHYGVPSDKIRVVPNAIDTEVFVPPPGGLEARGGYILWVGREARGKGLDALLKIFGELRARLPAAKLLVVGVWRPQAPPGVEYLGTRAVNDVARLYSRARLLISTSFYEADPLAVKEGMACGTPALVSVAAAAGVRHGESGLVVAARPDSPAGRDEFVDSAFRVMTDDELWRRLSRGALRARSSLFQDAEEEEYRGIYRALGASV